MTDKELAKYLKISLPTIHRWRRDKVGPAFVKLGKSVRYRIADVDQYLADLAAGAAAL